MIGCQYHSHGRCGLAEQVVTKITNRASLIPVKDGQCAACLKHGGPGTADTPSGMAPSLARMASNDERVHEFCRRFMRRTVRQEDSSPRGVGDVLQRLFQERGYPDVSCGGCAKTRAEMNRMGPAWCREHAGELARDILPRAKAAVNQHATWGEWLIAAKDAATAGFSPRRRIRWLIAEACNQWEREHPPPLNLDWHGPDNGRVTAIVPLFNPAGFRARDRNYLRAITHFQTLGFDRVITVEAVYPGQQSQATGDAIVIQASDNQRLWQKERLINLGIDALRDDPPAAVAWLDADLEWTAPIAETILQELQRSHVMQPFSWCDQLTSDGTLDRSARHYAGDPLQGHPGFAWAARWSIAARGLYDAAILGSGDRFMAHGWDHWEWPECPESQFAHWHHWWPAQPIVIGHLAHVRVRHHWHGSIRHRGYLERNRIIDRHRFNPDSDLRLAANGLWEWSGEKPALAAEIVRHFHSRREDAA